jgi:hypothetical protein
MASAPQEKVPAPDAREAHRGRRGDAMAMALHRRTGLPLGFVGGVFFDDGMRMLEFARTVVRVGENSVLDVDGLRRLEDITSAELGLKNEASALCVLDAEEREIRSVFSGPDGLSEARILEADAFIDAAPELLEEIERLAAPRPGF